jgi:hypothetical protein
MSMTDEELAQLVDRLDCMVERKGANMRMWYNGSLWVVDAYRNGIRVATAHHTNETKACLECAMLVLECDDWST